MRYNQPVDFTDIIAEPLPDFYFNNGAEERHEEGTLRVLSLFSGCGGMDIGLEGGFICHRKSAGRKGWIERNVNEDWVFLRRNLFRTVFACDILKDAQQTWLRYMSRYKVNPEIYHLESIVDLVKQHYAGFDIFPKNIDVVTGGFPCQDFSVAGKRKGFDSAILHNGERRLNSNIAS